MLTRIAVNHVHLEGLIDHREPWPTALQNDKTFHPQSSQLVLKSMKHDTSREEKRGQAGQGKERNRTGQDGTEELDTTHRKETEWKGAGRSAGGWLFTWS